MESRCILTRQLYSLTCGRGSLHVNALEPWSTWRGPNVHPHPTPGSVATVAPRATWTKRTVLGSSPHSSIYLTHLPLIFVPCTGMQDHNPVLVHTQPWPQHRQLEPRCALWKRRDICHYKKKVADLTENIPYPRDASSVEATYAALSACMLEAMHDTNSKKEICQKKTLMSPTGLTWLGSWQSRANAGPRCFTVE